MWQECKFLCALFLKVAELILDTKALAAERASKGHASWQLQCMHSFWDTFWWLGAKRDCHNSVISGSTEHLMAKINDNLADSWKCGKKVNTKHQDENSHWCTVATKI